MSNEKDVAAPAAVAQSPQKLTDEQEVQALRAAHQFFATFDRVPGFLANQWSQALDAIALVANSRIARSGLLEQAARAAAAEDSPRE